jgi:hypothetical protein
VTSVKATPAGFNSGDTKPLADVTVKETRQSLIDFLDALEGRGIKLMLRRNRVNAGAQQKLLTPEERVFINNHRATLKEVLQDPQRGQSKSMAAPIAEPEPEPVVWTRDYSRRIAAADVEAAGVMPGLTRQQAYERARDWLEEQAQAQAAKDHLAGMRAYLSQRWDEEVL